VVVAINQSRDETLSIIEKAEKQALETGSNVFNSLAKIKFLLVTIPLACIVIGLAAQQVIKERNIVTGKIKIGTFATPINMVPVPLASETQLVARLRANSIKLEDKYPKSLLVASTINNDVVTITATALGPETAKSYLLDIAQLELDFENGRLEKLQVVQAKRRASLETLLERFENRAAYLESAIKPGAAANMLALQQELKSIRNRISSINLELNSLALLNASDLFIDTTQIIQPPIVIASSNWYRPIVYGGVGLAIGLLVTFIIAIITIILSLTRRKKPEQEQTADQEA